MSDEWVKDYDNRLDEQSARAERDAEAFEFCSEQRNRLSLDYVEQLEEWLLEIKVNGVFLFFRCEVTGKVYYIDERSIDAMQRWDKEISNEGARELYKYLGE